MSLPSYKAQGAYQGERPGGQNGGGIDIMVHDEWAELHERASRWLDLAKRTKVAGPMPVRFDIHVVPNGTRALVMCTATITTWHRDIPDGVDMITCRGVDQQSREFFMVDGVRAFDPHDEFGMYDDSIENLARSLASREMRRRRPPEMHEPDKATGEQLDKLAALMGVTR